MANRITLKVDKDLIDKILLRHEGKNYSQCLKCGSLNLDAKELFNTMYLILNEIRNSDDESLENLELFCNDLLKDLIDIGVPEDCERDNYSFNKWLNENENRYSQKLSDDFGDIVHFKDVQDVVLKVDNKCDCFKD